MGFLELIVIASVGLLVIGPEKLPGAIKTCALWIGRIKRTISDTRAEFEQQIGADEIRRELHNERVMQSLEKLQSTKDELAEKLKSFEHDVSASEETDTKEQVASCEHDEYHAHETDDGHTHDEHASHHHDGHSISPMGETIPQHPNDDLAHNESPEGSVSQDPQNTDTKNT